MLEAVALSLAVLSVASIPLLLAWSPPIGALAAALAWGWDSGRHPTLAFVAFWLGFAAALLGLAVVALFGLAYTLIPLGASIAVFLVVGVWLAPQSRGRPRRVEQADRADCQ